MSIWNPWHGCRKISPGCCNCYVYRRDESVGRDASVVVKTGDYDLPIRKTRQRSYKLQPSDGTVFTCMTSDFFLKEADGWRPDCWKMMRERKDLRFAVITKRIHRFAECVPDDWGDGYPNVTIYCTAENQEMADCRLPVFLKLPIRHKRICHEPMLGPIDISKYLAGGQVEYVLCGGESGPNARPCRYEWILATRDQCVRYDTSFHFKQTGAVFVKDNRRYRIERKMQQIQAAKAGIDFSGRFGASEEPPREKPERDDNCGQMVLDDLMSRPELPGKEKKSHEEWLREDLFERIAKSAFRSRFGLKADDRQYVREKGMDVIRSHAENFIAVRLAPAYIPNDGKQTPMRGHPVFLAQHACACCCRGCLEKWHGIKAGKELTEKQREYVADTLMEWIRRQMEIPADGSEVLDDVRRGQ